ncbi:FAD/NAD(P)-binding protein [Jeotgalibaca sp. A122]|uniref:FAD/NAD(P)-binding protein n=1 Tax=Jeotgalibaca sp. A122 TaxID=3457322 RepID=UPI003FCFE05F
MTKIAIVGMGAAGVSVLHAMTKFPEYADAEIIIYTDPDTFGTGLPYQPDTSILLLNQRAETMSIKVEDPLDFVKWAAVNKGFNDGEKAHLPRTWYGEYLQETMNKAIEILKPTIIKEEVQDLSIKIDGAIILKTLNSEKQVNMVHLCIGHLPYQDPYHLKGHPSFIYNPYPTYEKLEAIPNGSRVGIVGTGLTGIDMMRYLLRKREGIKIYFFSDTGTFSSVRGEEPDDALNYLTLEQLEREKKHNGGFVSLSKMIEWFKLECEDKEINVGALLNRYSKGDIDDLKAQLTDEGQLGMLQMIIHAMDPYLADYWLALNETDKKQYFHDYRADFERFRSPIPSESISELLEGCESGKISIHKELKAIADVQGAFDVSFENGKNIQVDYLINATGQDKNIEKSYNNSKLLNNLLNKRIVQPEVFGGIQVIWPTSQAVSQRYGIISNLVIHGQLISGLQYGNNTVGMIRDHAYRVVKINK